METNDRTRFADLSAREEAVERAYRAAQDLCAPPLAALLESVKQSHRGQRDAIARLLEGGAARPSVAGGAECRAEGVQEALRMLEGLEDGLVSAYRKAAEGTVDAYAKRIVEVDLLPTQLRSHEQMRRIENEGLEAPPWQRG